MRDLLETLADDAAKDPEQRARELSKRELPKRFYKTAEHAETEGGFVIHLDGRPVKTPGKALLTLPTEAIAKAVAAEWAAQEKQINPGAMPLTRISNSSIDAVAKEYNQVADELARYAGTDALCYRADEPEGLVDRQTATWDPVLKWAEDLLGERFVLIAGLIHQEQPEPLLKAYRSRLDRLSPLQLSALHTATTLAGSAVLALAVFEGHLAPDVAWQAAHIEEDWNIERWGQDEEAAQVRAYKRQEFEAAALILNEA